MMSFNELLGYNPWWKDSTAINNDNQIRKWEESELKWEPRIQKKFCEEDLIYTLRGPRQVGKTTMVKLMIRERLQNGWNPWNLMYYSFDVETSPADVSDVVDAYLERSAPLRKDRRAFLFLDEISNITGWQNGIKKLKDQGKLDNCTVIATGSHSIDLRLGGELMPGRRGVTKNDPLDKIIPPMKFAEYVSSVDSEIKQFIEENNLLDSSTRLGLLDNLLEGKIDGTITSLSAYQNTLDKHFKNYLITGGIPSAINDFQENGFIHESTYTIYLESIKGDIERIHNEDYLPQLIPNYIQSLCSPTSWESLKKDTDVGSHHTVENYTKTLSCMFVLLYMYKYNSKKRKPHYSSHKKIYFQDLFFLHALNAMSRKEKPFEFSLKMLQDSVTASKYVENVIADHSVRLAFNLSNFKTSFDYKESVSYWAGKEGREVDFIVYANDLIIPIEVKYQNNIGRKDLQGIIDFKKVSGVSKALMLTKHDLSIHNECTMIPVPLFLILV